MPDNHGVYGTRHGVVRLVVFHGVKDHLFRWLTERNAAMLSIFCPLFVMYSPIPLFLTMLTNLAKGVELRHVHVICWLRSPSTGRLISYGRWIMMASGKIKTAEPW